MRYARFDVLADMPQEKTFCVEFDAPARAAQIHSLLIGDSHQPRVLVTVIIKNAKLTDRHVKALAQDFLSGKLSPTGGIVNSF
ncbi:MAG: hypothetical protein IAE80_22450 [Anaerolinea sp.]|nr:hypothetical protein [Anaerolinea sp.]